MTLKRSLLAHTALCTPLLLAVGAARGADVDQTYQLMPPAGPFPAVSGINGKLDFSVGGSTPGYDILVFPYDFDAAFRAQGAISVPLAQTLGLQVDGVVASIQDNLFAHVAGHLFWRDPNAGLIGGYGAYSVWDNVDRGRLAFEGEAYLGRISLETITGGEFGDIPSSFFTITDFAYYPTDNFRLSLGFRHNGAGNSLAGGLEYQFASGPTVAWAAFADGELGDHDYQKIFAGVRLYFGTDKSLIRRHREDDPQIKADERSLTGCTDGAIVVDAIVADGVVGSTKPCNVEFAIEQ
jgi:hypothetical protein